MNMFNSADARRNRGCRRAGGRVLALAGAVAAGALLLGACGQKGPLWVPGHGKDTPWPIAPPPAPAPAGKAPASGTGSSTAAPAAAPSGTAIDSTGKPAPAAQ